MTLSSTALLKHQGDITLKDVVTEPQEILALFASKKQQDKGKLVFIFIFYCCLNPSISLFVLLEHVKGTTLSLASRLAMTKG